ncbi:Uncharacterised protein [Candidatus Venteria ishoeyi]|uniref:Uncharacterized protein n=1 Tax=Candidatus Venteria ishoeyi TaxID=1899563 RepID=A0A1H6F582_9GAMM|nr:Uncharacterised protein [Candidatus Venteria ishoeyi]
MQTRKQLIHGIIHLHFCGINQRAVFALLIDQRKTKAFKQLCHIPCIIRRIRQRRRVIDKIPALRVIAIANDQRITVLRVDGGHQQHKTQKNIHF